MVTDTNSLEMAEGGTSQDMERKQLGKGPGALTNWRPQRERQVRTQKERYKGGKADLRFIHSAGNDNSYGGIATYPEHWKGHHAFLYYCFGTPISLFKDMIGPGMGLHSSPPCHIMHKVLPFKGLLYAELQIILLYSHKHKGNCATTECIGSYFNETNTSLSMLLHLCRTDINTARVHQLTTSWSSLSKRINGGSPLRPAR